MVDKEPQQPKHIEYISNVDSLQVKFDALIASIKAEKTKEGFVSKGQELALLKTKRDELEGLSSRIILEAARSGDDTVKIVVEKLSQLEEIEKTIAVVEQEIAEKLVFIEGVSTPEQADGVGKILRNLTARISEELKKPVADRDRQVIDDLQLKRNELQDVLNDYFLKGNQSASTTTSPSEEVGSAYKAVDDDTVAHAREILSRGGIHRLGRTFARLGSRVNISHLRNWSVGMAKEKVKKDLRREVGQQRKEAQKNLEAAKLDFDINKLLAKDKGSLSEADKNNLRGIILFLGGVKDPSFAFVKPYADEIRKEDQNGEAEKVVEKMSKVIPSGQNATTLELKRKFSKIASMLDLEKTTSAADAPVAATDSKDEVKAESPAGDGKTPSAEDETAKIEERKVALENELNIKRASSYKPDETNRAYGQIEHSLQGTPDKDVVREYVEEKGMMLLARGDEKDLILLEQAAKILKK